MSTSLPCPGPRAGCGRRWGEAHRRYTRAVNERQGWIGHLWQGRFASCALDNEHVLAAARHVELNPVRARLAKRARDWRWSSARAHLAGRDDGVVKVQPLLDVAGDWRAFLSDEPEPLMLESLRRHERTGSRRGARLSWLAWERALGRQLRPRKPGRKPRSEAAG